VVLAVRLFHNRFAEYEMVRSTSEYTHGQQASAAIALSFGNDVLRSMIMESGTERTLDDLHKLIGDVEALFKGAAGSCAGEAGERLSAGLMHARERIAAVEDNLRGGVKRGARVADRYVHANPWQSIGIAAAAAFILGALVSRRE
jgi:ElaB/YqjD/DUF883 family membrane-anchored ribosome-binding protein